MSIYLGNKKLAGTSVKLSHNIGDVFFTSRTDTVLAGAVECNGATYQTTSYTGEGSIGELLSAGKLPYISLSQYASDLAAHGSVRAFGWDGGSSTAFRVPTLQNVFLEAGQAASAGEYISAGLPNITGGFNVAGYSDNTTNLLLNQYGAFAQGALDITDSGCNFTGNTGKRYNTNFDASRSSSIYGSSSTVQPKSIKYRAMVQLYNGVTDEALATCESVESDIENLKKTSLNNKITNCITNISPDIKLELNNGTLTLKAGSKVYVPNGAGVFDEVVIANDLTKSLSANIDDYFYFYKYDGSVDRLPVSYCFSGATAPTSQQYMLWYDTTNNATKYTNNTGGSWTSGNSLPFCITDNQTVRQVFNGFGYIGSTVFALPGVKGLIPYGRNEDGSLKNIECNVTSVRTLTFNPQTYSSYFGLTEEGLNGAEVGNFLYDEKINRIRDVNGGILWNACIYAVGKIVSGKITSFTPKTIFHALDYNDSEYIAHNAMPSNRYVDLTVPVHGGSLTAPADGWFTVRGWASSGAYVWLRNETNGLGQTAPQGSSTSVSYCSLPAKKGDVIQVGYYGGTLTMCRFVYAEGAA